MSSLVNFQTSAGGFVFMGGGINCSNDSVLQPSTYRRTLPPTRSGRVQDVDVFWPRSSFTGRDVGATWGAMSMEARHQDWEYNYGYASGRSAPKVITGIARDSGGSPLGGATVSLYNTATGLLVETVTADAGGYFTVTDPNNVACFVVAYKPGSPDVCGTTVNTL